MDHQATTSFGRRLQWTGLCALLFAAALGLTLAPGPGEMTRSLDARRYSHSAVDQRTLQQARDLARLASTPDERLFAQAAIQLANHEIEVAFADALRTAVEHPPIQTPEIRALYARRDQVLSRVLHERDDADRVSKLVEQAPSTKKRLLQDELDVARAQLELDQDELDDINQDLSRAGGNAVAKIQSQIDRHNLERTQLDAIPNPDPTANAAEAAYSARNLVAQVGAYYALNRKITPLQQARLATMDELARLAKAHDQVEALVAHNVITAPSPASKENDPEARAREEATALEILHKQNSDRHYMADLNKRLGDEQDLSSLYGEWIGSLRDRQRDALYGMLRSVLWILLIVPACYFTGKAAEHLMLRLSRRRPHLVKFQALVRFAWQAAVVLLTLMVILGVPEQLPAAILGIVGAAVTVGLKDLAGNFVESRLRGLVATHAKPADATES